VVVNDAESSVEFRYCRKTIDCEQRSEQTAVDLGVEDRYPHSIAGEHVAIGAGKTPDEALASEATQVIGHLG
jgi:hypothetical protein